MNRIERLYKKRNELKTNLLWLLEQSRGVYKYALCFFLISLIGMLVSLVAPVASKYVVDSVTGGAHVFNLNYALIMLAATLVSVVFGALSGIFSSYVNEKFAFNVRARMFDRTQRGQWKSVTAFHSGDMLARLTGDVNNVASNIISILPGLLVTAIQLFVILVILLRTDPVLALIGLVVGPLGLAAALVFKKPYQSCQRVLRESQSEYYTFFQETLGNLDVVKTFQAENANNASFASFRSRRMATVMKSAWLGAAMSSVMRILYGVGYVAAFCRCAQKIGSDPAYTYGTMTLFLSLVTQLQGAVKSLGGAIPAFYSTLVSAGRIREITEQSPEDVSGQSAVPRSAGVSLHNVSFAYDGENILNNVSFEVPPNGKIAVTGASGAGKTTLIRLLTALTEPDEGTVEFVTENGREPASPSSRRLISYVPQGNTLLTGSVRQNLQLGDPDADDEKMWAALSLAGAAEFIRRDKRGLDMPIRERSGGVSAGQAQRICIARALLRDRPVMIFDEATSALDEETEQRIFENLSRDETRTYFFITHRSSMLKYCTAKLFIDGKGHAEYHKLEE